MRIRTAQLALLVGVSLLAADAVEGAAVKLSGRAKLDQPLVVTLLPVGSPQEKAGPVAGGMLRSPYGDGGRIVLVAPDGTMRVLTGDFHSTCDPEVSRDGSRMLFAGKRTAQDRWDIYEIGLDGAQLRQITRGRGDCRSPGYQSTLFTLDSPEPWYQLTFLASQPGVLNEAGDAPLTNLYSCKLDGSEARQITFNLSSDLDPTIMADGRLLFASWQRGTLDRGPQGRIGLFAVNIDGFDYARYAAEQGRRVQHMPCVTTAGLVVFVEAGAVPWDGAGCLSAVRTRRPIRSYQPITEPADGLFHTPSPLPDGRILVSRRPTDGSGPHAVYRFDPATKTLEPVFETAGSHAIQAKAVYRRPEPDGRSTVFDEAWPHGKFYCLNVYSSDLTGDKRIPQGSVKRMRVVEGIPARPQPAADTPVPNGCPPLAKRRILGEMPIEADGSFHMQVPADTPIQLQLLDADGLALRSCGWIWVREHEPRGCIGCHEDDESTPENLFVSAMSKTAELLDPPLEQRRFVDFRRDIVPLTGKCLACHGENQSAPTFRQDAKSAARVYEWLMGDAAMPYIHPGRARISPLVWHVLGKNTSRPWDGPAVERKVKPIPDSNPPGLTADEKRLLLDWIDLGAPWDGVPPAESLVPRLLKQQPRKPTEDEGM